MGQLCSCTRSQDKRGRKLIQTTILSRSPSARSSSYIFSDVERKPSEVAAAARTDNSRWRSPPPPRPASRPRSQGSSLEESGVYSKSSSTDEQSTGSFRAVNATQRGHQEPLRPTPSSSSQPVCRQLLEESSDKKSAATSKPNRTSLEKASSAIDVTSGGEDVDPDFKVYLIPETSSTAPQKGLARVAAKSSQRLEAQGQKIKAVLQRTIERLASEIDGATIAEYLQRSRPPGLVLTETDWNNCCDQGAAQDLFWDIITGQEQEDYNVFCDVIGSKLHLQHLVDLLQTLDSLVTLVAPVLEGDDELLSSSSSSQLHCDDCDETDAIDFDLDLIFCHKDVTCLTIPSFSNVDERSQVLLQVDCSNLSLAGGSYLPSVTGDELGQVNVPMVTFSLFNYCLCKGQRASQLQRILEQSGCFRELSLVKTHVKEFDLALLLQAAQASSSLVRLDLRLSSFGNDAAGYLGLALRHNSSLRFLNVASTGLSDIGCSRLMTGMARNRSLADLDIGFNDIRDTGCHSVAEALARSNPLRKVRMRDNGITCYGASALFQSLARNCRLSFLDISSNAIGNESLNHLSEALISNRTLRELNLENCCISYEGCACIARALRANTALRCLQLNLNPITDAGLEALADGLRYNHALETLSVNMCNVGNGGFFRLLEALRFNYTLKTVKLCYNNIGASRLSGAHVSDIRSRNHLPSLEEIFTRLYEILHYNPKLKVLLWGNDLEGNLTSPPQESAAVEHCLGNEMKSFPKSFSYSPVLSHYRQDLLIAI